MEKIKISLPVIVEGKYDKIKLDSILDAKIITTGGFGIFNSEEKKALIKRCISWPAKHDKDGNEVEIEDQGSYEIKLVIDPTNTSKTHFFDFIRYDHNPESVHTNKMDINNNLSEYPINLVEKGSSSHLHINTQLFQALFPKKIASPEAIKIDTKGLNYMTMINVMD